MANARIQLFHVAVLCAALVATASTARAQERPYFVTYNDHLEKQGELEVALLSTSGVPRADTSKYFAPWIEIEYGLLSRLTTELYLEGVALGGDRSFTGWRLETRFRPFEGEHAVTPLLYFEYERVSEASRIQKEIVGSGPLSPAPFAEQRDSRAHELEGRLILSSRLRGWNVAGNVVLEKNVSEHEGLEFGYTAASSRSIGRAFLAGVEAYGGLGSTLTDSLTDTRHFIAPVIAWRATAKSLLKFSTGFGLTSASDRVLLRVGYSVEMR